MFGLQQKSDKILFEARSDFAVDSHYADNFTRQRLHQGYLFIVFWIGCFNDVPVKRQGEYIFLLSLGSLSLEDRCLIHRQAVSVDTGGSTSVFLWLTFSTLELTSKATEISSLNGDTKAPIVADASANVCN